MQFPCGAGSSHLGLCLLITRGSHSFILHNLLLKGAPAGSESGMSSCPRVTLCCSIQSVSCWVRWARNPTEEGSPWNGSCSRADWWRKWCQFIMIGIDVWFKVKITKRNHSNEGTHGTKIRSGPGGKPRLINPCMDGSDGTPFALSCYISARCNLPENTDIFCIFRMTFLASHLTWT